MPGRDTGTSGSRQADPILQRKCHVSTACDQSNGARERPRPAIASSSRIRVGGRRVFHAVRHLPDSAAREEFCECSHGSRPTWPPLRSLRTLLVCATKGTQCPTTIRRSNARVANSHAAPMPRHRHVSHRSAIPGLRRSEPTRIQVAADAGAAVGATATPEVDTATDARPATPTSRGRVTTAVEESGAVVVVAEAEEATRAVVRAVDKAAVAGRHRSPSLRSPATRSSSTKRHSPSARAANGEANRQAAT